MLLTELLIGGVVLALAIRLLSISKKGEQRMLADSELSQISGNLNLMFRNYTACRASGIIGTQLNMNAASLQAIPLTLNFQGTTIAADGMRSPTSTRVINSLRFNALTNVGAVPGGTLYYATMKLNTSLATNDANGSLATQNVYAKLIVDANNKVVDCATGRAAGSYQVSAGGCSTPNTYLSQINLDGSWVCQHLNTALNDTGWQSFSVDSSGNVGWVTVTHNLGTTSYWVDTEYRVADIGPGQQAPINQGSRVNTWKFAAAPHQKCASEFVYSWALWTGATANTFGIGVAGTDAAPGAPSGTSYVNPVRYYRAKAFAGNLVN